MPASQAEASGVSHKDRRTPMAVFSWSALIVPKMVQPQPDKGVTTMPIMNLNEFNDVDVAAFDEYEATEDDILLEQQELESYDADEYFGNW